MCVYMWIYENMNWKYVIWKYELKNSLIKSTYNKILITIPKKLIT